MIGPGMRRETLVKVAKMYYLQRLSQEQIAGKLYLSRSTISNMIKICVDEKIVEFKINETDAGGMELRDRLRELYELEDVVIVPSVEDPTENYTGVARAAAHYVNELVSSGMLLGVGWGTLLFHMAKHLGEGVAADGIKVVQLMGGIGSKHPYIDASELVNRISKAFHGEGVPLLAPLIVHDKLLRDMLFSDPSMKACMSLYSELDIAVLSLGTMPHEQKYIFESGCLGREEWEYAQMNGAVGDFCGYRLDFCGRMCLPEINERVVAIDALQLRKVPVCIGLACGRKMTKISATALRGRYVNRLITDEKTALNLLRYELENKQ